MQLKRSIIGVQGHVTGKLTERMLDERARQMRIDPDEEDNAETTADKLVKAALGQAVIIKSSEECLEELVKRGGLRSVKDAEMIRKMGKLFQGDLGHIGRRAIGR